MVIPDIDRIFLENQSITMFYTHTLLTSSFLCIYELCHQETPNFFLMTTYSNKMMFSILLDAKINIENNLAFLASLLCEL